MISLLKLIKCGLFIMPARGTNKFPLCYIDDLIEGTLLAAEKSEGSSIYFISGIGCSFKDFVKAIAEELDTDLSRFHIPLSVFRAGLIVKKSFERCLNLRICPLHMDIDLGAAAMLYNNCSASIAKARNCLGFEPSVEPKAGVRLMIRWFKENKLL
jgi:nucleoside-diphosphate-sugar epimerase